MLGSLYYIMVIIPYSLHYTILGSLYHIRVIMTWSGTGSGSGGRGQESKVRAIPRARDRVFGQGSRFKGQVFGVKGQDQRSMVGVTIRVKAEVNAQGKGSGVRDQGQPVQDHG